jgi:itaconate CoA-transferase
VNGDWLTGIRVLALEQAVAVPFCTFTLAEMGADVIKVERPGSGDLIRGWDHAVRGLSTGFVWVNANKRDLAVDLQTPEGRRIVTELARRSDVVVENFAPGAMARLGLDAPTLQAENPRLVYCSLSGYGADGPYRDEKAYDILIQGESGIILTSGTAEAPAKVGIALTDLAGGTTAALAIVGALLRRQSTGVGEYLDVAMLDTAVSWLGYYPQHYWHGGNEPPRNGLRHQYLCPQGPYLSADGRYVNVVVSTPSDWERFAGEVLERPEWLTDPRFADIASRTANRAVLDPLVEEVIASRPSAEWVERLRAAKLPFGEVREMARVVTHPQLGARRMIVEADSPVGTLPLVRSPLGAPDRPRRLPAIGEHTDELLAELGYSPADRAALHATGVVAGPSPQTD